MVPKGCSERHLRLSILFWSRWFSDGLPPKPYKKNSVRTAFLPNSNAISISTYQCLSYHNLKALHISELQAAILGSLEKLLLVNFLDGYLYLGIGKV